MTLNRWTRQIHRWTSLAFVLTVVVNFAALGLEDPAFWVYLLPLPPLFVLLLTGLHLFVLPYAAALGSRRQRGVWRDNHG